jgi:hypothetical protein
MVYNAPYDATSVEVDICPTTLLDTCSVPRL